MSELLPCPFCGEDCVVDERYGFKRWTCPDGDCPGYNNNWWDDGEGERRWNTRHVNACMVMESGYNEPMNEWEYKLSCGHTAWWHDSAGPAYCPECGREVLRS